MSHDTLRAWCAARLPAIGDGRTAERWLELFGWARHGPVGVARLAEAHHDAMQILHEAGAEGNGSLHGVWASEGPGPGLQFDASTMTISGTKGFCSGLGIVDRALVTARTDRHSVLLDIDTGAAETITTDLTPWDTAALADTNTGAIHFQRHPVDRVIGEPGWYLERPGFWHGAIGPAACWAGGATGIVDTAERLGGSSIHHRVARGALVAERHLLESLLSDAGRRADLAVGDGAAARQTAYAVRHLVERSTARIIDTFERAYGPRPFVTDGALSRRVADVRLYTRQQHGDRDLAELGCEQE